MKFPTLSICLPLFCLFRPMWEDELNKYGGRWVISIGRCSKLELDKLWLDVVRSWESRAAPPEGIKCPPLSP